jgi:Lipopolysaccharide kinase (Kdo/WaaP) family
VRSVPTPPPGYARVDVGAAHGACLTSLVDDVAPLLHGGTLHAWAASRPERRELRGRDTAYAVALPDGATRIVVRHSRHGGLLAPLTRDLFLPPTRAPRELATSLALRAAGVRTPEVVAWVAYDAGPLLRRADVATRLVDGQDLAAAIAAQDVDWTTPTAALLRALAHAGARHPDLNLKNVLLADGAAWVLDIDVVVLGTSPAAARRANLARLERSLRKWRRLHALPVSDGELRALAGGD